MIKIKNIYFVLMIWGCSFETVQIRDEILYSNVQELEVTYQGSHLGSNRHSKIITLNKKSKDASLLFDVYFESDFQFVKGGKLHGLAPDDPITGGEKVTPDSWSSRIMFNGEGKISSYVYHQNLIGKFGESKKNESFKFQRNKWYTISFYTKLNSEKEKSDGVVKIFVDGKLIVDHQNILFWKGNLERAMISAFLFSTFHGGHDDSWAPKDENGNFTKVHARFKHFQVVNGLKPNN